MRRITNWPRALNAFMQSRADTRFAWGSHDCCIFAADAIQAITGVDLAEPFRGYDTKDAIRQILNEYGGLEGVIESIAQRHSLPERTPNKAQRGDLLLVRGPLAPITGKSMGVMGINSKPVVVASRGHTHGRRDMIERAWGIW